MGAMRPQTPHRSPRQALGGIHKVPAYGGIIKIAPDTLFSLPDYMPAIRGPAPKRQRTAESGVPHIIIFSGKPYERRPLSLPKFWVFQ
jgi:hypothetical protein